MNLILAGLLLAAAAHAADDLPARMLDLTATAAQRNDACFALRGNRSAGAIEALRAALADSVVRTCAAQNLRQAGALDALLQAVGSDDADVQAAAARELGQMRDPRALPALGHAALDSNVLVASAAIYAVSAYGEAPALPLLLQAARQPGLAGVTALERAAAFHNTAVLPVARQILAGADAASKVIALGVIGDLGDESDLPRLREIAAKPDPVASRGRGFGFMPVIDLARVAQNAINKITAKITAKLTAR
ncbi:MAG TPA: HEAT repeat domain-containing protein [Candidatus Solibacter sp.]|nr:HEAT repeat domain-containing protein [Candidatus Solibacter sp.]